MLIGRWNAAESGPPVLCLLYYAIVTVGLRHLLQELPHWSYCSQTAWPLIVAVPEGCCDRGMSELKCLRCFLVPMWPRRKLVFQPGPAPEAGDMAVPAPMYLTICLGRQQMTIGCAKGQKGTGCPRSPKEKCQAQS